MIEAEGKNCGKVNPSADEVFMRKFLFLLFCALPGIAYGQSAAEQIVALKARCHSKLLTAVAGMNYTRKRWCSWSVFVIPVHESTKELHRPQQSSLLQREPSYAE